MHKDNPRSIFDSMRVKPFLIALVTTLLVLLLLATGFWWSIENKSPTKLLGQAHELPRAAKFIQKEAALTIHWMIDPNDIPPYAEAVAKSNQRKHALVSAKELLEGSFALAGLDFDAELSNWIGPQVTLSFLETNHQGKGLKWIMALTSRTNEGAKQFLQRFWQTRSLGGTGIEVSTYRDIGIISGKGALFDNEPNLIASALIDDDLLLLASDEEVLKQSLDISQLPEGNQFTDNSLNETFNSFGDGIALITASPKALSYFFELPEELINRTDFDNLIATLQLEGPEILLKGALRFKEPIHESIHNPGDNLSLLAQTGGAADLVALIESPADLLNEDNFEPTAQLIRPMLKTNLQNDSNATATMIAKLDQGQLAILKEPSGWILITENNNTPIQKMNEFFQKQGLNQSEVIYNDRNLRVWSKLTTNKSKNGDEDINLSIGSILSEDSLYNIWAGTLSALQEQSEQSDLNRTLKEIKELDNDLYEPIYRIILSESQAQEEISDWKPWTLIQTLSGHSLQAHIKGLNIGLGPDKNIEKPLIHVNIRLKMG